jgi:hypothetical protein
MTGLRLGLERFIGTCVLCIALPLLVSAGDTVNIPGVGQVAGTYPGWIGEPGWSPGGGGLIDFARGHIHWSLIYYFRLRGQWPATWRDVIQQGIYQTDLVALSGDVIDPDDGSLNFLGDVYYFPPNQFSDEAFLASLSPLDGLRVKYMRISPPGTFEEHFAKVYHENALFEGLETSPFDYWLATDRRRRQLAVLGVVHKCLLTYRNVHGDYPHTWWEFIESGLSPLDHSSVNPVTGGPLYGDGRANDILYEYRAPGADKPSAYVLRPVDENGQIPTAWCTF